jgi:hypothetical protein
MHRYRYCFAAQVLFFSIISIVSNPFYASAQGDFPPWQGFGIEEDILVAKVIKHEPKFTLPIPALTSGIEVNLISKTYGKKDWEQLRSFPTIGLGFAWINYGIDSIYGKCLGIYPNLTIPLLSGRKLTWSVKLGDGLGYVTKIYSRTPPVDTLNVAIGAHFNDFAMISTDLQYNPGKHWVIQAGALMSHISNATIEKPNLGINIIGLHLGIRYFPVTSRPIHLNRLVLPPKNRWLLQARIGMALVASYTPGGPQYPVYIATAFASRRWLGKNKLFAGADYSYHSDTYAFLRNNGLEPGHEAQNSFKTALLAGNEFLMGRVGISLQAGAYLVQSYIKKDPVYEKGGINYYLVQHEKGPLKELFISALLKTDLTVAEFAEFGIGAGF